MIRGKVHFFGVWAEPQASLDHYHAVAGDLHTGRHPRETLSTQGPTVKDTCNAFLNWQTEKLGTGEIGAR